MTFSDLAYNFSDSFYKLSFTPVVIGNQATESRHTGHMHDSRNKFEIVLKLMWVPICQMTKMNELDL